MMASQARCCDLVDSSSKDDNLPLRRNTFPFYLFLAAFLDGLFSPGVSLASLATLQQRLRADARARTLPVWLRELVFHLAFYPRQIRRQVRGFLHVLMQAQYGPAVMRPWQAWLQLQCAFMTLLFTVGLHTPPSTSWKFRPSFHQHFQAAAPHHI